METSLSITRKLTLAAILIFDLQLSTVFAQGTAFTYQGQLQNNGSPASGTYNLTFTLFNTNTSGVPIAGPVTNNAVNITNGLFAVLVDFGPSVFIGATNWLQIGVATNGVSSFTTLTPRQQLTPVPYAIYAESANAGGISGTFTTAQLPSSVVTNGSTDVNLVGNFSGTASGTFSGDGTRLSTATNIFYDTFNDMVWLYKTTGTNICYGKSAGAFTNAVIAASSGDTVYAGRGIWDVGGGLSLSKPVNIIGAGGAVWDKNRQMFIGGTIITNAIQFMPGYSNSIFENIAVEHNGWYAAIFWNVACSNVLNQRVKNVQAGQNIRTASSHLVEISGAEINIDNLEMYNGGGHGIIFKGCSNVVARSLYSWNCGDGLDGLLVKADAWGALGSKGGIYNLSVDMVTIELFTPITPMAGIFIQCASTAATVNNVKISNVSITGDASMTNITTVITLLTTANCNFGNVLIDGVRCAVPALACIYDAAWPAGNYWNSFSNIVIQNVSLLYPMSGGSLPVADPWGFSTNVTMCWNNICCNGTNFSGTNNKVVIHTP
jgi:hypothetical protein